jgi:hypothetical protein
MTTKAEDVRSQVADWRAGVNDDVTEKMFNEYADLIDHQAKGPSYTPGLLDATAPSRIYLQIDPNGDNDDRSDPWTDEMGEGVSWCADSIGGCEIQYVRADLAQPSPAQSEPVK